MPVDKVYRGGGDEVRGRGEVERKNAFLDRVDPDETTSAGRFWGDRNHSVAFVGGALFFRSRPSPFDRETQPSGSGRASAGCRVRMQPGTCAMRALDSIVLAGCSS